MRTITAIFWKQCKDTLKNKAVFLQFLLFPCLTVIMTHTVRLPDMPENFFVTLFAMMYIGMAPLSTMSSILSEEKEKHTLRVLLLSHVSPWEYLLGTGGFIFCVCMAGAAVFALTGGYAPDEALRFLAVMAAGIFISLVLGAAIGIFGKNQTSAASITIPVMMLFSFLPMLGLFSDTAKAIADVTYTGQIHILLQMRTPGPDNIFILAANMFASLLLFFRLYRKRGIG